MRTIESEGSTIDAAIARALAVLGAEREQVHIEILEAECGGVLGFGRRKARVSATIRRPIKAWLEEGAAEREEGPARVSPDATLPGAAPATERGDRRAATAARPQATPAPQQMPPPAEIVRETLRRMGVAATVADRGPLAIPGESSEGQARVLGVEGKEIEGVVGRRGEVLEALEYLVNRMLDQAGRSEHVTLDAPGYRARRRAALEDALRRASERARARRRPVTLEQPLGPSDRKLAHEILRSERGLAVRSQGRGFYRKLTLIPEAGRRGGGKTAG